MIEIRVGDCRDELGKMGEGSVQCCVTSPPYWGLRDYGVDGQLGLEKTPELYVEHLVEIFREVKRVLRDDGVCWLNLGDSYAGGQTAGSEKAFKGKQGTNRGSIGMIGKANIPPNLKPKDLCGIPWRVAFALQADGWYLRSDIIWHKPNCMPESVTDRPTKSHEYVFLLSKSGRYFYDAEGIKEESVYPNDDRKARSNNGQKRMPTEKIAGIRPGSATYQKRNKRTVWDIAEDYHPLFAYLLANLTSDNPEYLDELLDWYSDDITLKKDMWTIPTQPYSGAHFATFPPALIEPMIKAGTSERGCCPECGAGWERVVERESKTDRPSSRPLGTRGNQPSLNVSAGGPQQGGRYCETKTIGWHPTCECEQYKRTARDADDDWFDDMPPIPCTVLDPFAGAGTVGLVADRLQRDAILIELNPEYAEMARRRIEGEAPMFANVRVEVGG